MKDELRERLGDYTILDKGDSEFKFSCKACGQCCHNRKGDQTIMVSPYDMFRIVQAASPEDHRAFIEKHFGFYIGSSSGILIAHLKTKDLWDGRNICVFLKSKEGHLRCSIHDHKPSACRLFPLGRIIKSGTQEVQYIIQHDVNCNADMSQDDKDTHTVNEWIPDRAQTEAAFVNFSDFTHELYKTINLHVLNESKKLDQKSKNIIHNLMHIALYTNYDYTMDFKEQFDQNVKALIESCKLYVETFSQFDHKIIPRSDK